MKNAWKILGIAFFCCLFVVVKHDMAAAKSKVKLNRPRNGRTVFDYKFYVKGKAKKIQEGTFLWVCLQEDGKKKWKPQPGPIELKGSEFKHSVYINFEDMEDREEPTKLNLIIISVDKAGNDALKKYIEEAAKVELRPYTDLPPSAQILSKRHIKHSNE